MCGIAGYYVNKATNGDVLKKFQTNAQKLQEKRGPDFFGSFISSDECVGLFHNRLSLVDLTEKGNQPMEKHGCVISFNGEIYNFRLIKRKLEACGYTFNSQTDTEVILSAYDMWGVESFNEFNGAYAFALYDRNRKKMLLVRDKIGEKPVYYYFNKQKSELFFASNIKLLLEVSGKQKLNKDRLLSDLIFNFWSDKSITHFENLHLLQVGTYLAFNEDIRDIKTMKYWDLKALEDNITEKGALERVNYLIKDAVSLRVQLDTKIASILSGGIDSSLISVMAKQSLDYTLNCYTLRKYGYDDEDIISATRLSREKGWIHHQVEIRKHDFDIEKFDRVTQAMEEPILDQVYIYINRNYEEASKGGFKAVLNGQGSDELFLGYLDYYPFLRDQTLYRSYDSFKKYWYDQFKLKEFINKDLCFSIIEDNLTKNFRPYQTSDHLNSVLRFGVKTHLPALLTQEDKQSLSWSVECRTVYTDYRLVEYLNKVPSKLKYADGKEKYLLRQIAKEYLPNYIIDRKKLGFPDLPDGKDILISKLIENRYIEKSEIIHEYFSPKFFDYIKFLPFSTKWKLCSIVSLEYNFC